VHCGSGRVAKGHRLVARLQAVDRLMDTLADNAAQQAASGSDPGWHRAWNLWKYLKMRWFAGAPKERRGAREEQRHHRKEQHHQTEQRHMSYEYALHVFGLREGYSGSELKKAYRDLMKKFHPDHGGANWDAQVIGEAYEILQRKAG